MQKCVDRYLAGGRHGAAGRQIVVEIGSADVNGTYRGLFPSERFSYLGCDCAPGPGVDLVLDDPYRVPLADGYADIVISGQMLEHSERFWVAFGEMMRILKPDGYLFLIAPSTGPIHRYPVDCWRFYPDGYRALADWAGCQVVDLWHDDRGEWNDLVGVFRHSGAPVPSAAEIADNLAAAQAGRREQLRRLALYGHRPSRYDHQAALAAVQCIANLRDSAGGWEFFDGSARPREIMEATRANGVGVTGRSCGSASRTVARYRHRRARREEPAGARRPHRCRRPAAVAARCGGTDRPLHPIKARAELGGIPIGVSGLLPPMPTARAS